MLFLPRGHRVTTSTLKAIAYKAGMSDSGVTSATYTIRRPVEAPAVNPAAGTYTTAQSVTITSATTGATIRYTTDGSTPSQTNGTVYSAPVTITVTTTLKAIAYKAGMTDSTVTSGTYTIEQALPTPWQHQDIGAVAATGTAAYAAGTFTIEGSGADIWETADEFHFAYRGMSGDGTIVARVASVENTNAWAEAGVMIRETLNADSKHASALVAPSGIGFLWRTSTGGTSAYDGVTGSAPYWVKLVRTGDSFSAYRSGDGATWTQLGTAVTISMTSSVYVGLAVTSHADGTLCTGVLDNVVVDQADCGDGIAPGDMATVCRLDPNATAGAFEGVTGPPPDLNGYTALYEARADNPNNNVDVAWYVSQSCQQTITTSDSESTIESKINGGSQFICVQPGDYTGKGVINISVSGSSGARKVLRYTRDGDNNDEPWNQSSDQQAKFRALGVDGSYWIIHRLSFPPSGAVLSDEYRIRLGQYSSLERRRR